MQARPPPPNGKYANAGRWGAGARKRSGRKTSGSGHHRRSRWTSHWLTHTSEPTGTRCPENSTSSVDRRDISQIGGGGGGGPPPPAGGGGRGRGGGSGV